MLYDADVLWLIPLLPLLSFLVIVFGLIVGPGGERDPRVSGYVTIAGIAGSFVLAIAAFLAAVGGTIADAKLSWFALGKAHFEVGVQLDPLAAVMLVIVTTVSLLVQIYSQGYMGGDPGYRRYFAFMALFTTSMLGLVLADNFLLLYVFWELVGLCSYLLIGFWYQKPEAAAAAKKAFITTRLGDLGFLVGILLLFSQTGSFAFDSIEKAVKAGTLGGGLLTVAMILVFAGAVGKSAQFPLHVWLPDAMEGPTPVSALIHAATMVAAGVYLVARAFPLFSASPTAMLVVAAVGGFTAIFAATHGLVQRDIKRVLAYSTVSQLGYMMLGLGVGAYAAGVFHLFNHAFFKALLFLAAGSVIHGAGEQDLFKLGGLARKMPWTAGTFLVGGLALAGIFPFAGFWSKDEILAGAYRSPYPVLFWLAFITAFITAFYVSRAWLLAFWGEPRTDSQDAQDRARDGQDMHGIGSHPAHPVNHVPHESPLVMVAPLVLLAIPAVLSGLAGAPFFGSFLGHGEAAAEAAPEYGVMIGSTVVALLGIGLAWAVYGARWISAESLTATFRPAYTLLFNKYYFDHAYNWLVGRAFVGLSAALDWLDDNVIDGAVNGLAWVATNVLGWAVDRTETGRAPNYALGLFAGIVVIAVVVIASLPGVTR